MLKEKLRDLNILFYVVLLILIIVCILLSIQNIRLNKIIGNIYYNNFTEQNYNKKFIREYKKLLNNYEKKRTELMRLEEIIRKKNSIYNDFFSMDYQDKFFRNFEDMEKELNDTIQKQENLNNKSIRFKNITNNNQENKKIFKNQRNNFIYHAKSEENEKEFTVRVKLPKIFSLNDVKIDLKDRNLIIKVEKQTDVSKENKKFYSYNSFFESFLIPETKAKLKDIKTTLNNNELIVIIPILK